MKVLITGVAGFIGSHTADKFLKEGWVVAGIDDYSTGSHKNVPKDVGFYCYDVTDYETMNRIIPEIDPDAIVHLAAQPSLLESIAYPEFDALVNIVGTINIAKIARDLNIDRFVFSSTSAVYSSKDTREDTFQLYPDNPYGISKLTAERYVEALLSDAGVVLRYGNVYGPRQVALGENQLVPRVLDHIKRRKEFVINGDGKQTRDFIYVEDVANANYIAASGRLPDVFAMNVSSGISHSISDVVSEIARLTAYTGKIEHGPAIDGERKQVVMPNELAIEQLEWKPKFTLHEGLKKTVVAYGK
jgi:UDP-glucose 4-epimerase